MACHSCGSELEADDAFCSSCGTKVESTTDPTHESDGNDSATSTVTTDAAPSAQPASLSAPAPAPAVGVADPPPGIPMPSASGSPQVVSPATTGGLTAKDVPTPAQLRSDGIALLVAVAAQLMMGLVVVIVGMVQSENKGTLFDWIRGAVWVAGASQRMALDYSGSALFFSGSGILVIPPLTVGFASVAVLVLVLGRSATHYPSIGVPQRVFRWVALGFAYALMWVILAVATRTSGVQGIVSGEWGISGISAFGKALLVIALAAVVVAALSFVRAVSTNTGVVVEMVVAARQHLHALLAAGIIGCIVVFLNYLYRLVTGEISFDLMRDIQVLQGILLFAPNLIAALAAVVLAGQVGMSSPVETSAANSFGLFTGTTPWWIFLVVGVGLGAVFVIGSLWGVRRPRRPQDITADMVVVGVGLGWWLLLTGLTGIRVTFVGFGQSVSAWYGIEWWSALVVGLVSGLALVAGNRIGPGLLASVAPGVVQRVRAHAAVAAVATPQTFPGSPETQPSSDTRGNHAVPGAVAGTPAAPSVRTFALPKSWRWIAAVTAVLVVALMGIGAWSSWRSGQNSPQAAVGKYLYALADSDANAALDVLDTTGLDRRLLTSDVLREMNKKAAFSDIQVTSPESSSIAAEGRAAIEASYRVGEDTHTQTYLLRKVDGAWKITSPDLPALLIKGLTRSGGGELKVAGTAVGIDAVLSESDVPRRELRVFPGLVPVTYSGSPLYADANGTFDGTRGQLGGYGNGVDLSLTVRPELQQKTQDAVDTQMKECVAATTAEPSGCPFRAYGTTGAVTWTTQASSYPVTVAATSRGLEFKGTSVQLKYSYTIDGSPTPLEGNVYASMNGAVDVSEDGEVTVKFAGANR